LVKNLFDKTTCVCVAVLVVAIFGTWEKAYAQVQQATADLVGAARQLPGLNDRESDMLGEEIKRAFANVARLPSRSLASVLGVMNAGLFEISEKTGDADTILSVSDLRQVVDLAFVTHQALELGANPNLTEDLALSGLAHPLDAQRLFATATALDSLRQSQVSPEVYQEFIAQALDQSWSDTLVLQASKTLIQETGEGLPEKKLFLALVIGIDQKRETNTIQSIIEDAVSYTRNTSEPGYLSYQKAVDAGIPVAFANELFLVATERQWSAQNMEVLFAGLINGQEMGLEMAHLVTDLIIRIAQDSSNNVEALVNASLNDIKKKESKKLSILNANTILKARVHNLKVETAYHPPERSLENVPVVYEAQQDLEDTFKILLEQSIQDYLGTPYKWGGEEKKLGTDCSGFTQGVFQDGGIPIARVSRDQYKTLATKLKSASELKWGDLVFFNKNGGPDTYITHVGIYLGIDETGVQRFVHSCCSKGVTVSRFDKRYYLSRFVGGARPASIY